MNQPRTIRIGTRGSPLALAQTNTVCTALAKAQPALKIEIVIIKTSGDWSPADGEIRLNEAEGGKGQFAKEIETALLDGDIDAAIHSMKDMDSNLPSGLVINHMLPREDPRDALLFKLALKSQVPDIANPLSALPKGATIGTASVRRAAFLLETRPDLKIQPLRGNVQTRIDKLKGGQVDATLLAMAGLNRLGLSDQADIILNPEIMLPAAGQGAVGIETREGDTETAALFETLTCQKTLLCVKAERAALKILDGSCTSPIAAYATLENGDMHLRLKLASLDGQQSFKDDIRGSVESVQKAETLGQQCAKSIKRQLPPGFLAP